MDWNFGIVSASAVVGLLVGLTGVGAGAAMTPLLVAVFGINVPTAVATDLLFATVTKIFGVIAHGTSGNVDWRLARQMWSGSIPAVAVGSVALVSFVNSGYTTWITWLLIGFVSLTGFSLVRRGLSPNSSAAKTSSAPAPRWLAPVGGAGLGLGVSLTSVGAGVLGMALLVRLSPADVLPRRLVATDLLHAIPIALVAGTSYAVSGLLDLDLLAQLLTGSIPGVLLGAFLSRWVSSRGMNLVLGLTLSGLVVMLIGSQVMH